MSGIQAETPHAGEFQEQVGEISLVLGKAFIEDSEEGRRAVSVGYPVKVGDQIVTTANGHAHVRFIDKGLVSVRPNSRLEVVLYDYNAEKPEQSTVKFNLIEGVARSISGDAAKSARQRFRLNTPIAAIGVRGTDFVVSATPETVRALVNEGVIVMAPYSDDCSLDALGPCGENAVELTGESLQVLEFNDDGSGTTPAIYERNPSLLRNEIQVAAEESTDEQQGTDAEQKAEGSEIYVEGVTSLKISADARLLASNSPDSTTDTDTVLDDYTPSSPLVEEVLKERQLIWGRWSWSEGQGELERITVPYAEARDGRERTIGDADYGLFRDQQGGTARVEAGLGVVGFSLSSAQAFYSSDSGIVAMQVKDGALSIDFNQNTFSTELSLEHASTGLIDFAAMGRIYSGGYFYYRSADQNVIGAVSLDGREAGYLFDRQLENGGIQGLTLWDSQ
ncbi:MAG: FecR domain-containing protein [Gammaproteobacteria bacterium]|nr:FecR domain-containing protein [Pseudomonadales bacterium]MCP5347810.1 FecR domain-containing protein [Pseudomonadales bacterium]